MRVMAVAFLAALVMTGAAHASTVFLLNGGGWGHGVGMSQWGAEGYARHGFDYRRILAHYYPHTQLSVAHDPDVRVLLARRNPAIRISSGWPYLVVDARGNRIHVDHAVRITRGIKWLALPARFEPGAGALALNGDAYRGDLLVTAEGRGLTVVNELPLERYLRGVVPSEIPDGWHEATYQAQAVAARTYTLATLNSSAPFDVYRDTRSQVYAGIKSEQSWTNLAVGATAGQVLTYGGSPITAYYFSSSGGRTSAVQDEWPKLPPEPYLVSVADPYDAISPHHRWPTRALTPVWLGAKLGLRNVTDAIVQDDSSHHAAAVRFLAGGRWKTIPGQTLRKRLKLRSTDFALGVLRVDPLPRRQLLGSRVRVRGFARDIAGLQLERKVGDTWRTVTYLPNGDFTLMLRHLSTLRLLAGGVAVPLR
jgi:stage II sporulation protein D